MVKNFSHHIKPIIYVSNGPQCVGNCLACPFMLPRVPNGHPTFLFFFFPSDVPNKLIYERPYEIHCVISERRVCLTRVPWKYTPLLSDQGKQGGIFSRSLRTLTKYFQIREKQGGIFSRWIFMNERHHFQCSECNSSVVFKGNRWLKSSKIANTASNL